MIILILGNILVASSAFLLTKNFFVKKGNIDFILSWFTLFLAQIIIVELSLGIFNKLYLFPIFLLHSVIFIIIFLLYYKKGRPEFLKLDTEFIFKNKILLFTIAIFVGFFLVKVWINLINPPICPESYQYHLSFPATWLKNGNLNNPIVVFGSRPTSAELTALSYYPINAELLFFWLLLPLRNAFLADIAPAPFYIIGILTIYSILRKYLIKKDMALFIGFLWALVPNLLKQIRNGTQIDVMCAVLFLLVLDNLLILSKDWNFKNALIFGISLGIFIGTKVLNIFWATALLPLFIYFVYKCLNRYSLKHVAFALFIIALMIFLFGSFSYLRTYLLTGNPFYPVKVAVFGREIFPGIIDKISFSKIFVSWDEFSLNKMFFHEGLGLQFLGFIFPGTIVPLFIIPFMKKKIKDLLEYALLFSIPAFMLAMYLFYIKAYWVRYSFPYLALGFIAAILVLNEFNWGRKYITILGLICILSSAAELAHRKELTISFIISFLLFFTLLFIKKLPFAYSGKILSFKNICIFLIIGSMVLHFLNKKYDKEEFSRYPLLFKGKEAGERDAGLAWQWLNRNTGSGKRIAYSGRSEFYPLFGSHLKNEVFYISVNDKPSLPHFYPDGLYRKEKNFAVWMSNLKKEKIDYLFVALPYPVNNESDNPEEFPIEDKWASLHPYSFRLVFSNSKVHTYHFIN